MGPHPSVAAVRLAVRRSLADLSPGTTVLVGCSGGADSLALAVATRFEASRLGLFAGAVTIDHGLQPGSAGRAIEIVERLREVGLDPVELETVTPTGEGGPEASARTARYAGLARVADRCGAAAVLLGHTRDDQAETVLLGLARGSGGRSLAGMPSVSGRYRRPLLGLDRQVVRQACAAEGLVAWEDPHNADPAYTRSRVRHTVLPVLESELGPGVAEALARTSELLRADADALDEWAERAHAEASSDGGLSVELLSTQPTAIRRRVLLHAARAAGCPGTDLFAVHVTALDALLTDWHGQAGVDLPGAIRAVRAWGWIRFHRTGMARCEG